VGVLWGDLDVAGNSGQGELAFVEALSNLRKYCEKSFKLRSTTEQEPVLVVRQNFGRSKLWA
jgi:hypothetical protein